MDIGVIKLKTNMRLDNILIIISFGLSLFHNIFVIAFLLLLAWYCTKGAVNCIKSIILICIRTVINNVIAVSMSNTQLKLAVIFWASILILYFCHKKSTNITKRHNILILLSIFVFTVSASSLFTSSYPITAIFKLFSFAIPFYAVIVGVESTGKDYDWNDFLLSIFNIVFILSLIVIPFPNFRTINLNFQGVFNHVNMFGIMSPLYITTLLNSKRYATKPVIRIVLISMTLYMATLSASRTGLFTCIVVILIYCIFTVKNGIIKIFAIISAILVFSLLVIDTSTLSTTDFGKSILKFIYKNDSAYSSVLQSRELQFSFSLNKFAKNNMFGCGFMVPYVKGYSDLLLHFDLVMEPGNIFLSVLGDTGILGLVLFSLLLISILGRKISKLYIFIAAILINFGEMVFFSTNNIAPIIWVLLAINGFSGYWENKNNELENES